MVNPFLRHSHYAHSRYLGDREKSAPDPLICAAEKGLNDKNNLAKASSSHTNQ